jgi:hypothetical protein
VEAAARTAGQNGDEPGELSMTRHGMVQPSPAGTQPPATDPRARMLIIVTDRAATLVAPSRQYRAAGRPSDPTAFIPALPDGRRAIADTSRNPKSP